MKIFGLVALLAMLLPTPAPEGSNMSIMTNNGMGHACPVNKDGLEVIFTAAHTLKAEQWGMFWSDQYGNVGILSKMPIPMVRDLLRLKMVNGPAPVFFELGTSPEIGDKVRWTEYDWSKRSKAMWPKVKEGKVAMIVAGHIVVDRQPTPGASGACLLNEEGLVVGVMVWGMPLENEEYIAGAIDLTIEFPEERKEVE